MRSKPSQPNHAITPENLPEPPSGWLWTKVSDIGEVRLGRQRSPQHHTGPHMRPYLRVANVFEDRIDLSDVMEMNFTPQEYTIYQLKFGDVLLNEGQSLELVGRPAMYRNEVPGACFQNTLVRFRAGRAVLPEFGLLIFRHYLHSKRFQKVARWTVNIAHLSASRFTEIEFPLPPLKEQRRILDKCGELFSNLDAGVLALKRAKANLKRYRAAILKAAVTGELTAEWRASHPNQEPAKELLTRMLVGRRQQWEANQEKAFASAGRVPSKGWRTKYMEPPELSVVNLPELPMGWCWVSMEQLVARSEYGTSEKCDYEARGLPVLRIPNISKEYLDLSDLKRSIRAIDLALGDELELGDLLMCRTNGSISLLGRTALVRATLDCAHYFASYLLRFRFVERHLTSRWVHLFLSSPMGRKYIEQNAASSAGQHNVSLSLTHRMPIPLPPATEQDVILHEVEQQLSVISAAEDYIAASVTRADRLRQSILNEAFAGRLVPQDPNDEPASVLLDRIRQAEGRPNGEVQRRKKPAGGQP